MYFDFYGECTKLVYSIKSIIISPKDVPHGQKINDRAHVWFTYKFQCIFLPS